ncbi:MAG: heavy metal translocating P-type ATPase [Candidatus Obscuribacterales bacterium]|nr:heavy metal translocating P-type ATPase [Candidatus Obscuribacterales bacterium]
MPAFQYQILHRLEGRIRLRIPRIKHDPVYSEHLYAFLQNFTGVRFIRLNLDCASLTIFFDERRFFPEKELQLIDDGSIMKADLRLGKDPGKRLERSLRYKLAGTLEVSPSLQIATALLSLAASALPFSVFIKRALLLLATLPLVGRGMRTFYEEGRPAVEFMDAASVLLLLLESAYLPAATLLALIAGGEYIRDFAAKRGSGMLDELLSISRNSAWLVKNESRLRVAVEKLKVGDSIVVYTGEKVPVAGIVSQGSATVIAAGSGGDVFPVELSAGALVLADSIVLEGKLYLSCTEVLRPRLEDRITERERRRLLYRTAYQRKSLKTAYSVVTPILLFAATAFILSRNLNQALTIICFDFVTGIRIALPTAVLAYMYKAGKQGVLIKTAYALETFSNIDVLILAGSGVVRSSDSELTEILSVSDFSTDELLEFAAATEYRYHHPAARAIYRHTKKHKISIPERHNSSLFPGLGVTAEVRGRQVAIGSLRLMNELNIDTSAASLAVCNIEKRGESIAYLAVDSVLAGVLSYRDLLRSGAAAALQSMKEMGLAEIVLVSGDSSAAVSRIASEIGTNRIYANFSPEEKADLLRDYQLRGYRVAIVGDDISDALAMAQADLAIAMSDSTDLARYRADIIITDDNLQNLPSMLNLSREAMFSMRQNMLLVSLPNWLGLLLSVSGLIGPLKGTVLNNGSVILAALNGLRPAFQVKPVLDSSPNSAQADS